MRLGLKVAIVQSGKSQRAISVETGIPESRLSSIVRGWIEPRTDERNALMRLLDVDEPAFCSTSVVLPSHLEQRGAR
jgi:hypothetical protein